MIFAKWLHSCQIVNEETFNKRTYFGMTVDDNYTLYCVGKISKACNKSLSCVPISNIFDNTKYGDVIGIVEILNDKPDKDFKSYDELINKCNGQVTINTCQQKLVKILPITKESMDFIINEVNNNKLILEHIGYNEIDNNDNYNECIKYLITKLNTK